MDGDRFKTEECLWCGHSEALGAVLQMLPQHPGIKHARYECVDRERCAARIKRRILLGP